MLLEACERYGTGDPVGIGGQKVGVRPSLNMRVGLTFVRELFEWRTILDF